MTMENIEKSRTKKKKQAQALQKLGKELAGLPIPHLKRLDLPAELFEALKAGKSITSNVAARRQRQFVGALMRNVDPVPIRIALDSLKSENRLAQPLSPARIWVDRLLKQEPAAIEECLEACQDLTRQRLRQLIRNINKDKRAQKTSKALKTLEEILLNGMDQR
ncbi:MAG: DUF615 domain-containing protein [Desulfobacter sp.]|nr:DUF615 domain-containing protein [Desulfobacter sp.]